MSKICIMSEDFFFISHSFVFLFTVYVYFLTEDIKMHSVFKKIFLVCVLVSIIGVLLVKFHLNVFSISKTIYFFSLPLITLLINRILFLVHNKFFGEPFMYTRHKTLGGGYWYNKILEKKEVTLRNKIYYIYCSILHFSLIFLFLFIFFNI